MARTRLPTILNLNGAVDKIVSHFNSYYNNSNFYFSDDNDNKQNNDFVMKGSEHYSNQLAADKFKNETW